MNLGQFRKLTKDLGDDVRVIVQGTHPNDSTEQFDVSQLLHSPDWICADVRTNTMIVRTIRCDARLAKLKVLG